MKGFVDFVIHQFLFLVSDSIIAGTSVSILFDVLDNNVTQKRSSRWAAKLCQTRSVDFIEVSNNILRRYFFVMLLPIVFNYEIVEPCTSREDNARR